MPSAEDESTAGVAVSTAGTGLGSEEAGATAELVDSSEAGDPKAGIVRIPAKSNVAIADNRICFSLIEVAASQPRGDISSKTEKEYAGIAVIAAFRERQKDRGYLFLQGAKRNLGVRLACVADEALNFRRTESPLLSDSNCGDLGALGPKPDRPG
jgi:hypothetical protein